MHLYSVVYTSDNKFFKAIYNYPTLKRFIFRVHSHAFNSFIFTLLCENRKISLIFNAVAEVTEMWEAELLDSLILINVVPRISVVVRSSDHSKQTWWLN